MIIIVEGIDRVGKTTLCNALSKATGIPIYKHHNAVMSYSDMDNYNETDKMLQLIDVCNITKSDIIFDRFHFSDYVYGILERDYESVSAIEHLKLIDNVLRKSNALLLLMQPTDIKRSSEEHGKDLTPYFKLMQNAYRLSTMNMIMCNYNSMQDIVDYVKERYNAIIQNRSESK